MPIFTLILIYLHFGYLLKYLTPDIKFRRNVLHKPHNAKSGKKHPMGRKATEAMARMADGAYRMAMRDSFLLGLTGVNQFARTAKSRPGGVVSYTTEYRGSLRVTSGGDSLTASPWLSSSGGLSLLHIAIFPCAREMCRRLIIHYLPWMSTSWRLMRTPRISA